MQRIWISHTGTVTITDFFVYYYFHAKDGKIPVISDWYTPLSPVSLQHLGGEEYRVVYDFRRNSLDPGQTEVYFSKYYIENRIFFIFSAKPLAHDFKFYYLSLIYITS